MVFRDGLRNLTGTVARLGGNSSTTELMTGDITCPLEILCADVKLGFDAAGRAVQMRYPN